MARFALGPQPEATLANGGGCCESIGVATSVSGSASLRSTARSREKKIRA